MKKYRYTAAVPAHFTIGAQNFSLHQGKEYELPSDNMFIVSLEKQGRLELIGDVSIPEAVPADAGKPKK